MTFKLLQWLKRSRYGKVPDAGVDGVGERLYQHRPWMQEGMYVIGTKPKSMGEGVVVVVHSVDYDMVWQYWDSHPAEDLAIFQWRRGALIWVGRKMRNAKTGLTYYVPIPPSRLATA